MGGTLLFLTAFLASAVKAVEALTIVPAVGVTRGWHTSFTGIALAFLVLALVVVALVGVLVHRPLGRVLENAIKFGVGLTLAAFGTFWGGEGVGVKWAAGDARIWFSLGSWCGFLQ